MTLETNGLKGMYFQPVETHALSTRGQADVFNLHLLRLALLVPFFGFFALAAAVLVLSTALVVTLIMLSRERGPPRRHWLPRPDL